MKRIDAIGSTAMTEVLIERTVVWLTPRFTSSENFMWTLSSKSCVFSLILSNTTTVSYREKLRTVRNPMTASGVISKPVAE